MFPSALFYSGSS